jgi:hypothetical protein
MLTTLETLDRQLLESAKAVLDSSVHATALAEAQSQLAPFRERMTPEAYEHAIAAALERQVRDHFGLPTVSFT